MKRERGVAAITALLIVAVAASAAALMLSQQSAMLDQTMMVSSRAQADLYAQAGLDWARGVLAEDRRGGEVDSLEEGWARPIAGLPVDRALVAGSISDEHGRFNLNNLAPNGVKNAEALRAFRALLASLDLPPDLADAAMDWIDTDHDLTSGAGAEDGYYLALPRPYRAANREMVQPEELYRVRGFEPAVLARLMPHVTALPGRTAVNVNTAGVPVLAAATGAPPERIAPLVAQRSGKPFQNAQQFTTLLKDVTIPANTIDVKSAFFRVRVQVAQDDVHLASEALVKREDNGVAAIIWRRPLH